MGCSPTPTQHWVRTPWPPTSVTLVATPSMEAALGLVGVMEYGVDQLQPVNVCSSSEYHIT